MTLKRARFALLLPALACCLLPRDASACDVLKYTRVQASPHVQVFQSAEATEGIVNSNIVAVIGSEAILLVDSGQFPSSSRQVLAELRQLSALPVRYIVNTHWHGDHLLANSVFKEAFPQAEIIAHSHTITEGAKRYGDDYAEKTLKSFADVIPQFRKQMEGSSDDEERQWIKATLGCAEVVTPEVRHTRYAAPTRAVDSQLELDLGNLPVVIRHLGSGNTPGDLVVWVKPDRLVATGDLVVYPTPYAIGSDLGPWPATLERLLALDAAIYVPGHGPVFRDSAYLRDVKALIESADAQLRELYAKGVARTDAARQLETAPFRQRYINSPMRRQSFQRFFVSSAVARFWSAADAEKKSAPAAPTN